MKTLPVGGGPPKPHGVVVVQSTSPAYQMSDDVMKPGLVRGSLEAWASGPPLVSRMPTLWLACASSVVKVIWLPSALAQGRIHCRPAEAVCTLPVASHTSTPALVRK